jgi:hypothetical protein
MVMGCRALTFIVPQNDPNDITSQEFIRVVDGEIGFTEQHLPLIPREQLEEMAADLAIDAPLALVRWGKPDDSG